MDHTIARQREGSWFTSLLDSGSFCVELTCYPCIEFLKFPRRYKKMHQGWLKVWANGDCVYCNRHYWVSSWWIGWIRVKKWFIICVDSLLLSCSSVRLLLTLCFLLQVKCFPAFDVRCCSASKHPVSRCDRSHCRDERLLSNHKWRKVNRWNMTTKHQQTRRSPPIDEVPVRANQRRARLLDVSSKWSFLSESQTF